MNKIDETKTTMVPSRSVQRVRHPLRARRVNVVRAELISPHFVRVTLGGAELDGFISASFDDHVKFMLPGEGQSEVSLPELGPAGPQWAEGAVRPVMRDYTPRRYDPVAMELDIEFALHGDGPAAEWAAKVASGQRLGSVGVGGPKGSSVIAMDYDWHLLIGDETALPAIARRLEELPSGSKAIVVIQLGDVADRRDFQTSADLSVQWTSAEPEAMIDAVQKLALPDGEGYAWAAGETSVITSVRQILVGKHGLDKDHVRAAAYWKRGVIAHHANIEG